MVLNGNDLKTIIQFPDFCSDVKRRVFAYIPLRGKALFFWLGNLIGKLTLVIGPDPGHQLPVSLRCNPQQGKGLFKQTAVRDQHAGD